MKISYLSIICGLLLQTINVWAQTPQNNKDKQEEQKITDLLGKHVQMSGSWFIAYQDKSRDVYATNVNPKQHIHKNEFMLKRSYITLKSKLNEQFSVRFTQDITIDREGSDAGNVETRLKYLYLKYSPHFHSKIFTGTWIEVGMVHTPWIDFEQHINTYRVQNNMFTDRSRLLASADFGFTFCGNIGPEMDEDFLKRVNKAMKGRYLSYAIGLYNGGGYSALEKNNNKVVQARLSWRPLAWSLPQLQVSAYANYGKGNNLNNPDFIQYLGMLSYTSEQLTITAQAITGKGDREGKYVNVDDFSKALNNSGYSCFAEFKPSKKYPLAIWARYDDLEVDKSKHTQVNRYIGGLSYRLNKWVRMVVDAEFQKNIEEEHFIYEANLEIVF